jgi:cysteine dioxygenase
MSHSLQCLFRYLDGLRGQAELAELTTMVASLALGCEDLAEFVRFSDQAYARNLVRTGAWYSVLVLCWKNGQRSPIHDHAGSNCCVRVLSGVLTETRFEFAPNGQVQADGSHDYGPGCVLASADLDLHQVSNLQAGDAQLVTLHVYSPPLLGMGTYTLNDRTRGFEPMLVELCDAAGI